MRKQMECLFFMLTFLFAHNLYAEIPGYESTDNLGLNKKERIDNVEKFLSDMGASLKKIESQSDEAIKKIKTLEDEVKTLKAAMKKIEEASSDGVESAGKTKSLDKDKEELQKIKADILSLKNDDIEKLRIQQVEINDSLKAMQNTVRGLIK